MESPDDIFLNAREMVDPIKRVAYLDQACGGDAALRARVDGMLRDATGAEDFFGKNGTIVIARADALVTEGPGTVIGSYKLLQKIGEGGMGVVYMAEQRDPVVRKVALKIVKLGMDTRQVVARFESERQALALMDHPNIAKVLEAGATEAGRPYFVMELVRGIKITEYCEQNHLSTEERLDLFVKTCGAVQHAHQKGIIHRDLKPSNILVADHDGVAMSKIIDFGIAKATTGQPLTDKTVFTEFEQFIGTPAYMSPEQAELSGLDIDTRTDIYSLGVLLYELLTGKTPFDANELLAAGLDEMRRTIREVEPVKPSTRLTNEFVAADVGPDKSPESHERKMGAELRRLLQEVRGDLDWIVMKCLAKDRSRRYDTANGLAMDIQRHLNKATENQRALAEDRAQQIAHNLYASHMNVAFHAWDMGDISRVLGLLNEHRPKPGEKDMRGFEWFYLWRLCHTEQLALGHNAQVRCVTFSPDGRLVATGGDDSLARVWDAQTGREIVTLRGHTNWVTSAAFAPDGKTLATGSGDQTVRLWDAVTGKELGALLGHKQPVTALAFSPDGKLLASATGKLPTGSGNPYTRFVDVAEKNSVDTSSDGVVKLWQIEDRKEIRTLTGHTSAILSLAISPDGKTLATGGADFTMKLWEMTTGKVITNITDFHAPIFAISFSPDGQILASAGGNPYSKQTELSLREVSTAKKVMDFKAHSGPVFSLAFAPDGETLATGGMDQIVRFWELSSGTNCAASKVTQHPFGR